MSTRNPQTTQEAAAWGRRFARDLYDDYDAVAGRVSGFSWDAFPGDAGRQAQASARASFSARGAEALAEVAMDAARRQAESLVAARLDSRRNPPGQARLPFSVVYSVVGILTKGKGYGAVRRVTRAQMSRAIQIATSSRQRQGFLKPGTHQVTPAGKRWERGLPAGRVAEVSDEFERLLDLSRPSKKDASSKKKKGAPTSNRRRAGGGATKAAPDAVLVLHNPNGSTARTIRLSQRALQKGVSLRTLLSQKVGLDLAVRSSQELLRALRRGDHAHAFLMRTRNDLHGAITHDIVWGKTVTEANEAARLWRIAKTLPATKVAPPAARGRASR